MFFVYVLRSIDYDKNYVGLTENLEFRLKQHNDGRTKSTKPYLPWKIVYSDVHQSRVEAIKREKYLKSAAGRKWRKNNIYLGD